MKTCDVCKLPLDTKDGRRKYHPACAKVRQAEQLRTLTERRRTCPHCGKSISKQSTRRRRKVIPARLPATP